MQKYNRGSGMDHFDEYHGRTCWKRVMGCCQKSWFVTCEPKSELVQNKLQIMYGVNQTFFFFNSPMNNYSKLSPVFAGVC